jgi:hypothetical protein
MLYPMKKMLHLRFAVFLAVFALGVTVVLVPWTIRAQSPTPASISELLEQGIYDEETKGDLDGAIAAYQQLITQAQATEPLAAQAELRLGQCYLKKGRTDDATAAFRKLIHDFPNEKELVAKATALLPGPPPLAPAPWVDGERMLLKYYLASGIEIGMTEYRSDLVVSGTQSIWRVGGRVVAGAMNSVSSVDTDWATMRPFSSHWKTSLMGEDDAVYHPGVVDITRLGSNGGVTSAATVEPTVYDNEEAFDGFRRLPFKAGYKTTVPIFSSLGGAEFPLGVEMTGEETVTVPAGTFDCIKLQLSIGQTFWYSNDAHRYLVQLQVGAITAKLDSVAQRKPNDPVQFHDDELGITLTAPPQWVVCRYKNGQPKGESLIRTYDPDADSDDGGLRIFPTAALAAESQKSSRAWAEHDFKVEMTPLGGTATIRPDSWKDYTVSGRPGVGYIADYTEGGKAKTEFSLCVLGPKESEHFVLVAPSDKFAPLMQQFDTIIASYQRK